MGQSVQEDAQTPQNAPLSAKYTRSFAYSIMKDRVPVILTKALDGLVRDKENIILCHGEKAREELKEVIGYISKLKSELQTDKEFTPLSTIGEDAAIWNDHLKNYVTENGVTPTYFQSDWMYSECYVYRRLREAFLITEHLKNLDPFHRSKVDALIESLPAIKPLALHMNEVVSSNKYSTKEEIKKEFLHLVKVNLWGNKCDLSLSAGQSVFIGNDPFSLVDSLDSFILVNQSEDIWNTLADCKGETVDIILDNAGYELITDFCLAEFLVTKCDINKVRFRAKCIPWYVSDVMEKDFYYLLNALAEREEPFAGIANRWLNYVKQGKFEIIEDKFWTLPFCYNHMERVDKKLYNDLKTSKLLIFKGDLNHRKLLGDINWPTTHPFKNALRNFHPSPLATLRTLKADIVCGLRPGQAEETEAKSSKWQYTGDFAVIQFDSEKHST